MIIKAADRLCSYIGQDYDPVTAGVKVSQEFGLTRDQIKLACQAYNRGVVNADRAEGDDFSAKFAVTSRIDPDDVIEKVYPTSLKAAVATGDVVSSVYSDMPTTKTAARQPLRLDENLRVIRPKRKSELQQAVEPKEKEQSNYAKAKAKVAKISALKQNLNALESVAGMKRAAVVDAFRSQFRRDVSVLPLLHKTAVELYGDIAGKMIDYVAQQMLGPIGREKYAAECSPGCILGTQPFPLEAKSGVLLAVKEAVDALFDWAKAEAEFPKQALELRVRANIDLQRGEIPQHLLLPGMTEDDVKLAVWEKQSSMLMGLVGAMGARLGAANSPPSGLDTNAALDARVKLNDPAHQNELRRLNAEMMLNDLINNDEVISSYSPEQVANAFEEIGTSSPGILDNPVLARAGMRRVLQGNLTTYDAESLVNQSQLGPSL